jgi:hypothetical protein
MSAVSSPYFFIYDSTSAINVRITGIEPRIGDSITAIGKVSVENGLTYIGNGSVSDTIIHIKSGNILKSPVKVTKLNETTDSKLIRLENLRLIDLSKWTTNSGSWGFQALATNGKDTFMIWIPASIDLP